MIKRKKPQFLAVSLGLLVIILLVGPFFVPVANLEGLKTVEELADPDSLFITINDLDVHYKLRGVGDPVFILLHGFGASLYSWQAVMQPLSQLGTVIAYDRPAFGLTERPLDWDGDSPYGSQGQVDLLLGLLDQMNIDSAILIGNSAGGSVAMQFYLQHPDRVEGLILVDPAVYTFGGVIDGTHWILRTPQMHHLGPLVVRQIQEKGPELLQRAWYDSGKLTEETIELYSKPLMAENWDIALWEMVITTSNPHLDQHLDEFMLPILVITGEADLIVPTEKSIRLSKDLPDARLVIIPQAGHVPHEEQPGLFLNAVFEYVDGLPLQ